MASGAPIASSSDQTTSPKAVNPPEIVKFAFKEFAVDLKDNKWKAICGSCQETIHKTRGTTTSFSRYVTQCSFLVFQNKLMTFLN